MKLSEARTKGPCYCAPINPDKIAPFFAIDGQGNLRHGKGYVPVNDETKLGPDTEVQIIDLNLKDCVP